MQRAGSGAAIDVHAHYLPRDILDVDRRFALKPDPIWDEALYFDGQNLGPMPPRLTDIGLLLNDMDTRGISQRLCCTASWMTFYREDVGIAREVARANNERMAQMAADHPGKLYGLASLPLQDIESAIAELDHAITNLGLTGIAVGTSVNGEYYDHPRFRAFFARVEQLEVPVFFHPDDVAGAERLAPYYLGRLIGNPHEATLSLLRVILGGVMEAFPRIKLCYPMGGGSLPFLLGRVEHGWDARPEARELAPRPPIEYLRQCYFDTILHSQAAFDYLVSVVPVDHVVMGSDYPWDMGPDVPREVIDGSTALTDEQRAGVLAGNVDRLLARSGDATRQEAPAEEITA